MTLKLGSQGENVRRIQQWLNERLNARLTVDGDFGPATEAALKRWQRLAGLSPDGIWGHATTARATALGFGGFDASVPTLARPVRGFAKFLSNSERWSTFGRFKFRRNPQGDREAITITDDWPSRNIITVRLPMLERVAGASHNQRVHRLAARQLVALWHVWDAVGLMDRVTTFDGLWVPRFIRGTPLWKMQALAHLSLSNHAVGTAFDINARANPLGGRDARPGEKGCVWELVPIAVSLGWFWGGWFSRNDGMHFEISRIMTLHEIRQTVMEIVGHAKGAEIMNRVEAL